MLIRRLAILAPAAAFLATLGTVFAQPEGSPPTATTLPPATETTEVVGTVPNDFVGRWLAVGAIKLPSGQQRPVPRIFEIRQGAEHLELILGRHPLPDSVNKKIEQASQAGTTWTPDAGDLRAVDETWGKLPPIEANYAKIEHKLLSADAYPAEFKDDETTKDSAYSITNHEFFAGRTGALRSYTVYGVRERTPDTLSGGYLTSTIAAAPMPIPIVLKGDFKAYRLGGAGGAAAPAGRSWFERLFAGCGG